MYTMIGSNISLLFFADAQPQPVGAGSSLFMMLFFMLAFWFLLIAPQRKRQKAQEKMIAELKDGDEVMTTSGVFGTILQVKGDRFVLKTSDSKLELHKNFIQAKLSSKSSHASTSKATKGKAK